MKKVIVCGVLTVLCIVATVLLRGPMGNADLEYTEVEYRVLTVRITASARNACCLRPL